MDILDFPAAEICHLIHASSLNLFKENITKAQLFFSLKKLRDYILGSRHKERHGETYYNRLL